MVTSPITKDRAMALTAAFKTKAFRLKSVCGREYKVPVTGVATDYARFLMKEDKLTRAQADAQMTDDDVTSWFYGQFSWDEVGHYGVLVKEASAKDVERALNLRREGLTPGEAAMARLVKAED